MEWGRHNRYNWYSISDPYFIRIKRIKKRKRKKGKVYMWKLYHEHQNEPVSIGVHASVPWAKEAALAALLEVKIIQ